MMFFLLFIMLISVLFGDSIKGYITNDINGAAKNVEVIDISNVALGVTDRVDNADISKIAVDIERKEVYDGLTIEELSTKLNK